MAAVPILIIQQALFLLVILALRAVLPHLARWRHIMLLWYVALVRLAIPLPLPDPFGLFTRPSAPVRYVPHATPTSTLAQAGSDWLETSAGRAALCAWMAVAIVLLACHFASLRHWKRTHAQIGPVDDPDILSCADSYWRSPKHSCVIRARLLLARMGGKAGPHPRGTDARRAPRTVDAGVTQGVRLAWSEDVDAPVVFGCAHPVVLMPLHIAALDSQAKRQALEHELTHVRRQDPLFKLAFTCVCCLFWFNPLVWGARRLAFRDVELACDEEMTRFGSQGERRAYANLLLGFAQRTPRGVYRTWVSHFSSGPAAFLFMRIKSLKTAVVESGMPSLAVCALASCLALLASTTGPASGQNPWVVKTEVGSVTLPQAWQEKVEVSILRTANGSELAFIYPLGDSTQPILGFGSLDEHPEMGSDSGTTLVAVTSHNGYPCALWRFDHRVTEEASAKQAASNQLVRTEEPTVDDGLDMDSLDFLKREVVPTFCAE